VYVDEIIITGSSQSLIQVITHINSNFTLKQLRPLDCFLIEVHLLLSNCKLPKHGSNMWQDPSFYRSIIDALQYVITCPKLSSVVNKVCWFLASLESNWVAVKRIFGYLKPALHWSGCLSCHYSTTSRYQSFLWRRFGSKSSWKEVYFRSFHLFGA